jgi:hypothetical protein
LTLELCEVITWSWWLVTAPLWVPFGLGVLLGIVAGTVEGFMKASRERRLERRINQFKSQ